MVCRKWCAEYFALQKCIFAPAKCTRCKKAFDGLQKYIFAKRILIFKPFLLILGLKGRRHLYFALFVKSSFKLENQSKNLKIYRKFKF